MTLLRKLDVVWGVSGKWEYEESEAILLKDLAGKKTDSTETEEVWNADE